MPGSRCAVGHRLRQELLLPALSVAVARHDW